MITRKIALAIVTIAALGPVLANATPEQASMNACAKAFASSISAGGASPGYRLASRATDSNSVLDFFPSEYTFTLEAHDPKSGTAVARATCSVDSHGVVTQMSALPVEVKTTTLASRY